MFSKALHITPVAENIKSFFRQAVSRDPEGFTVRKKT
jgi:hypothetical protein